MFGLKAVKPARVTVYSVARARSCLNVAPPARRDAAGARPPPSGTLREEHGASRESSVSSAGHPRASAATNLSWMLGRLGRASPVLDQASGAKRRLRM